MNQSVKIGAKQPQLIYSNLSKSIFVKQIIYSLKGLFKPNFGKLVLFSTTHKLLAFLLTNHAFSDLDYYGQ